MSLRERPLDDPIYESASVLMHETFGIIHRLPAQARWAVASISKLAIQNSKMDWNELARCHRARQQERVIAIVRDIGQDPVAHSLLKQAKALVDQICQLPAGSPKTKSLERKLVTHSHYTVPAMLRGDRTSLLGRKFRELTTPARHGGHDADAVIVWDTYSKMFPPHVQKPRPAIEDLALTVADLVRLQLTLYGRTPKPDAASIGYVFGMFDCGAQIAKLDLNTPSAQEALKLALSMVFPGKEDTCLRVIMAHQCSPEFTSAAMAGGNDYNNWVSTQGKATPTSLLHVLDPRKYPKTPHPLPERP